MRRRVSVQSTTPMTSTSQPAASSAESSSSDDKIFTIDVVANNVIDMVFDFCMNAEARNGLLTKIVPNFQTAGMNCAENLMDGEMGKRGEKVVVTAGILMFLILFGVGNRWVFYLIQLLIRVVSVLMLIAGLAIFLNSVWEMKDHFSLLLTPSAGNKVVTTGMYRIVRHPMYCGLIMIAFGWSISQQQIFKVVLSMGLFIVLVSCTSFLSLVVRSSSFSFCCSFLRTSQRRRKRSTWRRSTPRPTRCTPTTSEPSSPSSTRHTALSLSLSLSLSLPISQSVPCLLRLDQSLL